MYIKATKTAAWYKEGEIIEVSDQMDGEYFKPNPAQFIHRNSCVVVKPEIKRLFTDEEFTKELRDFLEFRRKQSYFHENGELKSEEEIIKDYLKTKP